MDNFGLKMDSFIYDCISFINWMRWSDLIT